MKRLLLAGACLSSAVVGCQSELPRAVRVPAHKTSVEPGGLVVPGSTDPTTTTTVLTPTTTTVAVIAEQTGTTTTTEPITCPDYGHPLHHLSCDEAAARANPSADAPSPQARSVGRGDEPAGGDVWAALAECESGTANVDTGNGYSGYLQFSDATWRSVGYSGRAVDHSYATQIEAGQALQARSGWGQWPACSAQLGLL